MLAFVRAGWKAAIHYPSRIVIDVIRPILAVTVMVALVQSIARISGSDTLLGMSIVKLATYYAALELMANIPTFSIPWRIQDDIETGTIGMTLSRPVEPSIWYFLFGLGRALPGIIAITLMVGLLAAVTGYWVNLPGFLVFLVVYTIFKAIYDAATGLISAWTYHIGYFRRILGWTLWGLFGGRVVPLDVLPQWFQTLTMFLPFRYMTYSAAKALIDGFNPIPAAMALAWVFPMYFLYRWLYYRAVERAEVFGG